MGISFVIFILFQVFSIDAVSMIDYGTVTKIDESKKFCDGCGKENSTLKQCSACKSVRYCSKECQIKDWQEHKKICKSGKKSYSVLYFPSSHRVNGVMTERARSAQQRLYTKLKSIIKQNSDIKIISEDLYYDLNNEIEPWYKVNPRFANNEAFPVGYVLQTYGALSALISEGIVKEYQLVKSVSLEQNRPYRRAEHFYDNLRNMLFMRALTVGQDKAIAEIMSNFRRATCIEREIEIIDVLANSMRSNPNSLHIIIFGSDHKFSYYFSNCNRIDFRVADDFIEAPDNMSDQSLQMKYEYDEFLSSYENPLQAI